MNETRFGICWRVEDFPRIFVRRGHDDETANGIGSADIFTSEIGCDDKHVKYANSAQVTGFPLTHVALHGRFERISEFTDNRNGPFVPRQMAFFVSID